MKPIYKSGETRYEIARCEPQNNVIRNDNITCHALSKGRYPGIQMPQNLLPGLKSIGFWNADSSQNWDEDLHRHEGVQIAFLESGTITLVTENKKLQLRAGQFALSGDPNKYTDQTLIPKFSDSPRDLFFLANGFAKTAKP